MDVGRAPPSASALDFWALTVLGLKAQRCNLGAWQFWNASPASSREGRCLRDAKQPGSLHLSKTQRRTCQLWLWRGQRCCLRSLFSIPSASEEFGDVEAVRAGLLRDGSLLLIRNVLRRVTNDVKERLVRIAV